MNQVAAAPVYEAMDGSLVVAVADPVDYDGIKKLRLQWGSLYRRIVLFPTTASNLERLIELGD